MDDLIPILGILFVLGPPATWLFSITPLGRALTERLRGRSDTPDEGILDLQDEIERLHDHLRSQDERIEELHDRIDFTERLLARPAAKEPDKVETPV